ncbi:hypothetical protein [Clostridium saccharoperbutylacetonicum]|jgi:uncharacterized membrane protein
MKQNKNYLLIGILIICIGVSFFTISQNFLLQMSKDGIETALPLLVPALVLIVPLIAIIFTVALRELRYRKAIANGIKSVGLIKNVSKTGNYVRKLPEVKFEFDVLDENENSFYGEVTTVIREEELELLKEGIPVPVIYKIYNNSEITIDRKPEVQKLRDKVENYKLKNNIK